MKKTIIHTLLLIFPILAISQNNVGVGTLSPNTNAKLDIQSTDKGLLIPRLTTAQRTILGAGLTNTPTDNSMLIYDIEDSVFYYWKGTFWTPIPGMSEWADADRIGLANLIYAKQALENGTPDIVAITDDGNIGIGTSTPITSLDINTTDAVAMPYGTTAQRPAPIREGAMRYNTTTGVMEFYNGTCWINVNTPHIGATYIQWANAADPNTIYPCTIWVSTDIQNGEFIRATGGNSNVPVGGALTGTTQNFAITDHQHNATLVIDNNATQTTSSEGNHNHGGQTGNVSSFNASAYIPYDDNLGDNTINGTLGSNGTVCGNGWNGIPTVGNFVGTLGSSCLDHTHVINNDGNHTHTVPSHNHTGTVTVTNVNSGNTDNEIRPTNVAVKYWRRTN